MISTIVSAAVPEFVSVTVWAGLVAPTACEPNARLVGERVASGVPTMPVPLSKIV